MACLIQLPLLLLSAVKQTRHAFGAVATSSSVTQGAEAPLFPVSVSDMLWLPQGSVTPNSIHPPNHPFSTTYPSQGHDGRLHKVVVVV